MPYKTERRLSGHQRTRIEGETRNETEPVETFHHESNLGVKERNPFFFLLLLILSSFSYFHPHLFQRREDTPEQLES